MFVNEGEPTVRVARLYDDVAWAADDESLPVVQGAVSDPFGAVSGHDQLGIVLFRRRGWDSGDYTRWADQLLYDQVAFVPPSAWEGETVARFAFLHPHTSMNLVRQILDRMN